MDGWVRGCTHGWMGGWVRGYLPARRGAYTGLRELFAGQALMALKLRASILLVPRVRVGVRVQG